MTFVVSAEPYRFVALDDTMREHHAKLVEILGREDEVRSATESGETPSPSDLLLAADSPGPLLITGKLGCGQDELARIIHQLSKRRDQPLIELPIGDVPDDRRGQNTILKQKPTKGRWCSIWATTASGLIRRSSRGCSRRGTRSG
jgi:hypothetical protein